MPVSGLPGSIELLFNDNGGELPTGLQNVSYTKKSPSKQAGDQKRYEKHQVTQRITRSQTQNYDCDIELPGQDLTGEGSFVKVFDPINILQCEPLNNTPVCSITRTSTHNSVHSDIDTLCDSKGNNEHDEHKHDHDGRNLENKGVDEVDMDDPMDITTTPCYFAYYPGHDDSYRSIRRTCTTPSCGIYICFGCQKKRT